MNRRLRWVAAAAAASLALVLSACGGGSSGTEVAAGADGKVKLRVTSLSLCNELGLYTKDGGYFEKHGLDVEFVKATGGNAGVAALQSGAADVVTVSPAAVFNAMAQGIDLTIVSGAGRTTPQTHGIIVKADSPLQGPKDLAQGKTLAVVELSGTGAALTKKWVENATGGQTDLKFTALPFPELAPAVVNGTVTAAQVTASEIFTVTKAGTGRSIGNAIYEASGGPTPVSLYAVSPDFLAKNQKTMEQFTAAMQEAAVSANDPANTKKFDVFSSYCKQPAADLAQIPQVTFEGNIDRASFMRMVKVVHDAGMIPQDFAPESKVAEFAWSPNT